VTRDTGLDADLTAWLEAARLGGLPAPTRKDRWQPLRAGVVNLWEFEAAEYWYARGWVQLTGRNESGKSSLMALTTLIPWLADTSSPNIDTLGRSGKRFRYYVEPTGTDGDRRSSDTSTNRGWLWVEYGRLRDGVPEFFTTLLFAEARAASTNVALQWCTAEGPRVRAGLELAPNRVVAHPRELAANGFLTHDTATAYKQHVARHLLGSTVERLEAAGKMLRVTRTPKLGAELQVAFVSDHLRTALPELDRAEVDALAAGWDQLDQLRADLDATREAVDAVDRFRTREWLPWVRAELRRHADRATRARTDFDRVTRDVREAEASVAALTDDDVRLSLEHEAAASAEDAARSAREELQESARYQDARARLDTLNRRRDDVRRLERHRDTLADGMAWAQRRAQAADAERQTQSSLAEQANASVGAARDLLAEAAVAAHVPVASGDVDLPLLEQRLRERRSAIGRARNLLRETTQADQAAARAEESAADRGGRADEDRARAENAWRAAEEQRSTLVTTVAAWAATLTPTRATSVVDGWIDGLPATVVNGQVPGRTLVDTVRGDWYEPIRRELDRGQADAARRRAEAQSAASEFATHIQQLVAAPVPEYVPPATWGRRARPEPSASGAPLWALLDPRQGVSDAELAGVEAALAAQGVLDAWVTPDGIFRPERDHNDTVLALAAQASEPDAGRWLADLLVRTDTHPELATPVEALLATVRLLGEHEPLPEAGWAVGVDGRWRAGGLAGRAGPQHDHAEWLGESARAAQRRRAIAELEAQRAEALDAARTAASEEAEASKSLDSLATRFATTPSDTPLRAELLRAYERTDVAERSAAEAEHAQARAADQRAVADRAAAALHDFCTDRSLPQDDDGLLAAVDAVNGAAGAAAHLRNAAQALQAADDALSSARERLAGLFDDQVRVEEQHAATVRELAGASAAVAALEATMGASDREVVDQLERLGAAQESARTKREGLADERRDVGTRLGRAQATLTTAEDSRDRATNERDAAYAAFRVLVDRGLAAEADVELPDVHASTVDRVREQLREVRRVVNPPRWPDDPEAQTREERRLYTRLTEQVHEVRTQLEARGRSLHLVAGDDDLPRVEVFVDASGVAYGPRDAATRLGQIYTELGTTYTARVQETLDELLGSTFLDHLRTRGVGAADALVSRINRVLADHPVVTTSTALRIVLEPAQEHDRVLLEALRGTMLANPDAAAHVREHLRTRVEAAKQDAAREGDADWRERLVTSLDYRNWFTVSLQRKVGAAGAWRPLTTQAFAEMSGGARAVSLMLPLVATLAALYEDMDGAPRPLWLDEAFDGLDAANRAMVMDLFGSFDLDVLLAGPNRLVNVRTVPAAALYQVVRAPAPMPGADLTLELWAGGNLTVVDLPTSWGPLPQATSADAGVSEEALW
jgi:uncharacterized protein (TIGR02680 family)